MSMETKEQVLERLMDGEKPACPHCKEEMQLWEVPPFSFSDGLGWGVPYLFVCFNDECSAYKKGWDHMMENYAHNASYRCMKYPDSDDFGYMPVFSPAGAQGQVIDEQAVLAQEAIKEAIKKGFSILAGCYTEKDWVTALQLLVDATQPAKVRLKAAEMLGDIAESDTIETMKNCKCGNEIIQKQVDESIARIHERFFTRECPFCAELIKKRAKVCKHCGKDLT